uniref:Uncharacterized protein n=1 Tax=Knipowitschia caucasica TaxID=637954 RepID=A0AAV2JPP7_KNICA
MNTKGHRSLTHAQRTRHRVTNIKPYAHDHHILANPAEPTRPREPDKGKPPRPRTPFLPPPHNARPGHRNKATPSPTARQQPRHQRTGPRRATPRSGKPDQREAATAPSAIRCRDPTRAQEPGDQVTKPRPYASRHRI